MLHKSLQLRHLIVVKVKYHLKSIYEDSGSWSDRAMALKALGDIGTDGSLDYLRTVRSKLESAKGKENAWNVEIIDLYVLDR